MHVVLKLFQVTSVYLYFSADVEKYFIKNIHTKCENLLLITFLLLKYKKQANASLNCMNTYICV